MSKTFGYLLLYHLSVGMFFQLTVTVLTPPLILLPFGALEMPGVLTALGVPVVWQVIQLFTSIIGEFFGKGPARLDENSNFGRFLRFLISSLAPLHQSLSNSTNADIISWRRFSMDPFQPLLQRSAPYSTTVWIYCFPMVTSLIRRYSATLCTSLSMVSATPSSPRYST